MCVCVCVSLFSSQPPLFPRCRRSCRCSQDAEDAEEERHEGDNEIEMAKADHRIGWLNRGRGGGGGGEAGRRMRGLIRTTAAASHRAQLCGPCSTPCAPFYVAEN